MKSSWTALGSAPVIRAVKARQLIEAEGENPRGFLRQAPHPDVVGEVSDCGNCQWHGIPAIIFPNIPDFMERIEPGGTVPSGECPQCGALCYPADERQTAS